MTEPGSPPERPSLRHRFEDAIALVVLGLMATLPLVEAGVRELFGGGFAGAISFVQHMTLWISFLGAALAARSGRLLALSTGSFLSKKWRFAADTVQTFLSVAVTACLCWASIELVRVDRSFGDVAAWGIPIWVFNSIMPIGFALIAARQIVHAPLASSAKALAAFGCVVPLGFLL
ncbi:MAG: TRAP transporter small permease, partial [Gammaproteobacteria bacterium]